MTIRSVSGIDVLPSARSVYYIFKGAALINVVAGIAENRAWPDWKDASPVTNMRTFTLEALINGNAFKNQISTIMGIEGKFLVRIGDSGVDPNQIQVASSRNLTNSVSNSEAGRWYQVAVTRVGKRESIPRRCGEVQRQRRYFVREFRRSPFRRIGRQARCFWIGYSYASDRYFDGQISEVRIWNKALTPEEISPRSISTRWPQLPTDWWPTGNSTKEPGKTLKDQTSYGNDLTVEKELKWVNVSLPELGK